MRVAASSLSVRQKCSTDGVDYLRFDVKPSQDTEVARAI